MKRTLITLILLASLSLVSTAEARPANGNASNPNIGIDLYFVVDVQGLPQGQTCNTRREQWTTLQFTQTGPPCTTCQTMEWTDWCGIIHVGSLDIANAHHQGIYRLKTDKSLASTLSFTYPGAFENEYLYMDYPLKSGDADDNNCVNISDFNIFKEAMGSACGGLHYDDRADFNEDCVNDINDFGWIKANMGVCGSAPLTLDGNQQSAISNQ